MLFKESNGFSLSLKIVLAQSQIRRVSRRLTTQRVETLLRCLFSRFYLLVTLTTPLTVNEVYVTNSDWFVFSSVCAFDYAMTVFSRMSSEYRAIQYFYSDWVSRWNERDRWVQRRRCVDKRRRCVSLERVSSEHTAREGKTYVDSTGDFGFAWINELVGMTRNDCDRIQSRSRVFLLTLTTSNGSFDVLHSIVEGKAQLFWTTAEKKEGDRKKKTSVHWRKGAFAFDAIAVAWASIDSHWRRIGQRKR